ncbi:uncharacterized protein LOC135476608 [Liolophura sinensis]|uniref:uncharacterized protein LOC135476608 n=1 Tax=Liolophura sinensis TaxID=3198878 RepID=UPI003158CE43
MIVSGAKDYRVAYKSYQDWLLPQKAVLSVFSVGIIFVIVGFILLLVGTGSVLSPIGAVFLGLGLSLLAICLLLCPSCILCQVHPDQSTQTKERESQVREVAFPAEAIVTSKPPQGVLKTGRSPSTEPKRVRLQAERDTGFSGGTGFSGSGGQATQSLSSSLLTEKFPLRSPEWKEEQQKTQVKTVSSSSSGGSDLTTTENHYETLPLKVDPDPATARRPGQVFSRSQEAEVSRHASSTQVVYPQQATGFVVTTFKPPPPPVYPPQSTNLSSSSSSSTAYRSGSPAFQREYGPSIISSPFPIAGGQYRQSSTERQYQSGGQFGQASEQQQHQTGSHYRQSSTEQQYHPGVQYSQFSTKQYHQPGGQSSQFSTQHYQTSSQSRSGGQLHHFHEPSPSRSAGSVQHYHVTSETRPVKIQQYYHTVPQPMTANQRQMTSEYHWADMGAKVPPPGSRSAGDEMTFEDHRSSKMSLYDNLNGWTEGSATM